MGHQTKIKTPTRQTLEEIAETERLKETVQVLAQPHRRGDNSDMTDALGMFVRIHECGRECFEGGNEYFRLVYRWRVATGVPVPLRLSEGGSVGGGEMEMGTVHDWLAKIRGCENAMKCSGLPGFRAAQKLVLEGEFPEASIVGPVKRAIHGLAMELGRFPF